MTDTPRLADRTAAILLPPRLARARRQLAACEGMRFGDWRDELLDDMVQVLRERVAILTAADDPAHHNPSP